MSIQSQLNNDAIAMLPKTKAYIAQSDRAGHHNAVVVNKICNSTPCLDDMTSTELDAFDDGCLAQLKWLDNDYYCHKSEDEPIDLGGRAGLRNTDPPAEYYNRKG